MSTLRKISLTATRAILESPILPARTIVTRSLRTMASIPGPVESSMHQKLTETFQPLLLQIKNDSSKHSHHSAMRAIGGGSGETHFTVTLVSPAFSGKTAIARHRLVNNLLKEEFEQKGLHALSLRLKTQQEAEKEGLLSAADCQQPEEQKGCGCGNKAAA